MMECEIEMCPDCAETVVNGPGEGTPYATIAKQWPEAECWMFSLDDSEDGHIEFSTRSCDGCDSRLAGSRHPAIAWQYKPVPVDG